jgi:chemotaxis methyl-accepting protein methylase
MSMQITSQENKAKLLMMAIRNNMRELSYAGIKKIIRNCNRMRKRKLLQAMVVQRTKYLRKMEGAYVEEIISVFNPSLE